MITTLHIRNIGIIDDITIDFKNGFNVLTGETGAGKSLIINAIDLLCGGRFSKEMIRKDTSYSSVEACIYSPCFKKDFNEEYIIVSRQVHLAGKNICKINGSIVTVNELKNFMMDVVDIHGQYDNQNLMDTKSHISFLDDFCGDSIKPYIQEYKKLFKDYNQLNLELNKNYGNEIERQRTLDLLKYQYSEISEANLKVNEEEQLQEKKRLMVNYEKVSEALNLSTFKIENNILVELEGILKPLEKISDFDVKFNNKASQIRSIYYELQEHLIDLDEFKTDLEFDEEEFKYIQERLDQIFSLKRKYGSSIDEILKYKDEVYAKIEAIENLEEYNVSLKNKIKKLEESMLKIAEKMNNIRKEYAEILQHNINNELRSLEMSNAKFKVNICFDNKIQFKEKGLNKIEFLISTNIGEDFKPLIKIASGGEISRIMLAIKTVLSDVDKVQTIIFDEIDTGTSGSAVKAMSEKIKTISKKHQVFVVTHQPILAASADNNYKIVKKVINGKTISNISLLNEKQVIEEIAKISSGTITSVAMQHALELRNSVSC